jgi:hypothetical protein
MPLSTTVLRTTDREHGYRRADVASDGSERQDFPDDKHCHSTDRKVSACSMSSVSAQ